MSTRLAKDVAMPGSWDPQLYRDRARAWQVEADKMEPGPAKDVTLALAEGYAKLADLIEQDGADRKIEPSVEHFSESIGLFSLFVLA
jgi:hypothetical protein